jgi:hypothetical protein
MSRFALLAVFVALSASVLAADAPSDLPKDTLPAKLALDEYAVAPIHTSNVALRHVRPRDAT